MKMKADRRAAIGEMIEKEGIVYLANLSRLFPEVSVMTLRRDLDFFEANGVAVRIHGGAQKKVAGSEPFYSFRANRNRESKELIAKLCLEHITEGSSIYLDCGTTSMELAKLLPDIKLSIITAGPNIGMEVAGKGNADIVILGGQLNRDNLSISGRLAEDMLDEINIDLAFVASSGFSISGGFSCGRYNEGAVKRKVLKKARKKIILMDDSKFNKSLMFTFASADDVDLLITNAKPPDEICEYLSNKGKEIIYR